MRTTAERQREPELPPRAAAWFGGLLADHPVEVATDPGALEQGGWWVVVMTFEGAFTAWRMARRRPAPPPRARRPWVGLVPEAWTSSLDRDAYLEAVSQIRHRIREGEVYQVNLCRVLTASATNGTADPWALADALARRHPAPYAAVIDMPAMDAAPATKVVSASPELFLGRRGLEVTSSPIKGTGATAADLQPKDQAENVMIVDLVRNDLQRVCDPGSVEVTGLLQLESHPGLVHLVSTVRGRLGQGVTWSQLLAATSPPGSVSGAPKSSALRTIADLEPVPRGPYCGAIGWIDADRGTARLAVGIRTFWWNAEYLHYGTGAGITWGSDPATEWAETELKARRLMAISNSSSTEKSLPVATWRQ